MQSFPLLDYPRNFFEQQTELFYIKLISESKKVLFSKAGFFERKIVVCYRISFIGSIFLTVAHRLHA